MSELDRFMINKELGRFGANQDGTMPCINLSLDAMEEKANKVAGEGLTLTGFQTALFTFLHEYEHYRQFQDKEVTAAELNDPNFLNTDKCKQLEKQADEAAACFIKAHKISFDPLSLQVMSNEIPNIPKVGEQVMIMSDVDFVDTVYFDAGFHCGMATLPDAVELGQYKISIKKGSSAVINSVSGSKISLIELSDIGTISAYDPIKGKEISNQVQIHSCTLDLQNLKRI